MEIIYIPFGWLLGLLSPAIVEKIKSEHSKKQFFNALCSEAHELQFRITLTGFLLGQRYGSIDRAYLLIIKPIIGNYEGSDDSKRMTGFIEKLLSSEEKEYEALITIMRAKENMGLSLKTFSSSFLESNLSLISKLPINLQSKIHEFKNTLNVLNQEIISANESHKMTFDSSLTDENHGIINANLSEKYATIQGMCQRTSDKLELILKSKI